MRPCIFCGSELESVDIDWSFKQLVRLPKSSGSVDKTTIDITVPNVPVQRCISCQEVFMSASADEVITNFVNEEVVRRGLWPAPKEKTIYLSYGHKEGYNEIFDTAYETAEQALNDVYGYAKSPANKFSTCSLLVINAFERLFEARLIFDLKLIVGEKTYDFVFDNRDRSGILQPCDIFDVNFDLSLMHPSTVEKILGVTK
jgi:hypothetical protein